MKTVLIFAGTTEGRELVEILDRNNIQCHVCVATEYGSKLLKTTDNITIHTGRLDEEGMQNIMEEIECDIVVDATHPYAVLVTSLIKKCAQKVGITYIRLLRDNDAITDKSDIYLYDSIEQCADCLSKSKGKILLTTGSKQLCAFTSVLGLRERIVARVIPGIESLNLCYEAGLEGNQIVAMQGPFSQEMNEAVIKEYDIKHLVTKESGTVGGVAEKIAAASKLGICIHMIKRPFEDNMSDDINCMTMKETIEILSKELEIVIEKGRTQVVLAGIGPGNQSMMTQEVVSAVSDANVIFGANRMLDAIECRADKYPYYRKEDIIPILNGLAEKSFSDLKVVILFSGDTGFYSGCRKMYEAIKEVSNYQVSILPGISSVSTLCSRIGDDWQDGNIVSLHGVNYDEWSAKVLDSVRYNNKTFFIASGVEDVRLLGELLSDDGCEYEIKLGYQLSYPDECIMTLTPQGCLMLDEDGLFVGLIVTKETMPRYLAPTLNDDFFIRDKVPMTKEEVRKLSICQMNIKENDIVYDIGSGSGSIAVQTGLLSASVKVFAIECNPDAVALIKKNVSKANVHNVEVIENMAPDGLDSLPIADVAFIGGSKGNLKMILDKLYEINSSMRVVMNAVSIETICEMNKVIGEMNIENLAIQQISVSKAKELGDYHMLNANNPVFVFSFDFVEKE